MIKYILGGMQVLTAALYYWRVLGSERVFRRFLLAPGAMLLGFRVLFLLRPDWYFLSSEAETLSSSVFLLLEAAAVILALKWSSGRTLAEIILFLSLRTLILVAASLLPFAVFALFAGETVASLVTEQWNDLLFVGITAVLDMGLLIAAAEAISHYIKRQTVELRWSQFVPVIGAQAVSLGIVAIFRGGNSSSARMLAALAILLVIYAIADAVLLTSLRAVVRNSELERSIDSLLMQQSLEKSYYLSLRDQLKSAQRMRHDYRNTLITIDTLIQNGDLEKARSFAEDSQTALAPGGLVAYTGNEVLDAVLFIKSERAKREGIDFRLQLTLPKPLFVADTDLMSIFGNLLDNALEYLVTIPDVPDRSLEVSDVVRAGLWVIRFSNTFVGDKTPDFVTRKADKELHGYGMGIVQSIINVYNGNMSVYIADGKLSIAVTLNVTCAKITE